MSGIFTGFELLDFINLDAMMFEDGGASYSMSTGAGSLSTTGTAVNLKSGRKIAASHGTQENSGMPINLRANRRVHLSAGGINQTGQPVSILKDNRIHALFGSSIMSGSEIGLGRFYKFLVNSGALSLSGADLSTMLKHLAPEHGELTLTGSPISFIKGRAYCENTVYPSLRTRNVNSGIERIRHSSAGLRITGV